MSPNETDINKLYREFYYYNQPVIITFDIEYVMLVAYVIHTVKRFLYIGKTRPLALLDYSTILAKPLSHRDESPNTLLSPVL